MLNSNFWQIAINNVCPSASDPLAYQGIPVIFIDKKQLPFPIVKLEVNPEILKQLQEDDVECSLINFDIVIPRYELEKVVISTVGFGYIDLGDGIVLYPYEYRIIHNTLEICFISSKIIPVVTGKIQILEFMSFGTFDDLRSSLREKSQV